VEFERRRAVIRAACKNDLERFRAWGSSHQLMIITILSSSSRKENGYKRDLEFYDYA
jgi:hypothetical protein